MVTSLLKKITGADNQATNKVANTNSALVDKQQSSSKTTGPRLATVDGKKVEDLNAAVDIPEAQIKYQGDPDSQVIVFDMDETLGDTDWKKANPKDPKVVEKIKAFGDRELLNIPSNDSKNKFAEEINYVLRPGTKELLEYLHGRGYKIVLSTRNYGPRLQTIVDSDPLLSKMVDGVLGREDLLKEENKDFKKYPHHPDKLSFGQKVKNFFRTIFVDGPKFLWFKLKYAVTPGKKAKEIRWTAEKGTLGKYPPNAIELLKQQGNHKLDNCRPARFLVDNKASREPNDAKRSRDWAWVNPNIDRNGDGKATAFYGTDEAPKDANGKYLWVQNVINQIESGWKETLKANTGAEPVAI